MSGATRLVAILGGGDWADASVDHIVVPAEMDVAAEAKIRGAWYRDEYCPALRRGENPKYYSLVEWLIKNGARVADEHDIELVDNT